MNYYGDGLSTGGWLFILFVFAFYIYTYWRIFEKAGKPGWAALIPIYNTIILLEIVGKPWWWLLLFLIPGVNIIFAVWMTNLLSLSFGKGVGFTIGLLLLSFIFYPILAFSLAEYKGPAGK
ncbi:MAG: DUF5684 domain-containing protein [Bacteroidales bacterium]|nr:DUF5684 domain-containing protein [Bacteroidales bacterium]